VKTHLQASSTTATTTTTTTSTTTEEKERPKGVYTSSRAYYSDESTQLRVQRTPWLSQPLSHEQTNSAHCCQHQPRPESFCAWSWRRVFTRTPSTLCMRRADADAGPMLPCRLGNCAIAATLSAELLCTGRGDTPIFPWGVPMTLAAGGGSRAEAAEADSCGARGEGEGEREGEEAEEEGGGGGRAGARVLEEYPGGSITAPHPSPPAWRALRALSSGSCCPLPALSLPLPAAEAFV